VFGNDDSAGTDSRVEAEGDNKVASRIRVMSVQFCTGPPASY
jgi:hypothetical protein